MNDVDDSDHELTDEQPNRTGTHWIVFMKEDAK